MEGEAPAEPLGSAGASPSPVRHTNLKRALTGRGGLVEEVILRITVSEMLAIAFGEYDATLAAALGAQFLHRRDVVIHSVVGDQPVPLSGVSDQHIDFGFDDAGDVDAEPRRDAMAE